MYYRLKQRENEVVILINNLNKYKKKKEKGAEETNGKCI